MLQETEALYGGLRRNLKEIVRAIRSKQPVPEALRGLLERPMQEELHLRSSLNGEATPEVLEDLVQGFLEYWESRSNLQLPPQTFDALCDRRATFKHMLIAFQKAAS